MLLFLHLTRTIKSVVTGQAQVSLEWKNTLRKKRNKTKSILLSNDCFGLDGQTISLLSLFRRIIILVYVFDLRTVLVSVIDMTTHSGVRLS